MVVLIKFEKSIDESFGSFGEILKKKIAEFLFITFSAYRYETEKSIIWTQMDLDSGVLALHEYPGLIVQLLAHPLVSFVSPSSQIFPVALPSPQNPRHLPAVVL